MLEPLPRAPRRCLPGTREFFANPAALPPEGGGRGPTGQPGLVTGTGRAPGCSPWQRSACRTRTSSCSRIHTWVGAGRSTGQVPRRAQLAMAVRCPRRGRTLDEVALQLRAVPERGLAHTSEASVPAAGRGRMLPPEIVDGAGGEGRRLSYVAHTSVHYGS